MTMAPTSLPGLLLLNDDAKRVDLWVQRGIVPSYVVQLSGWAAVAPAGPARGEPPYDDALTVIASMPVPMTMRSAMGFFQIDGRAVMTVHPRRWRALPRWLVWEPGRGLVRVNLPQGTPADLVRAAGVVDEQERVISGVLRDKESTPLDVLSDVIDALALPGGPLLRGRTVEESDDAMFIEPHRRAVTRFERVTKNADGSGSGDG